MANLVIFEPHLELFNCLSNKMKNYKHIIFYIEKQKVKCSRNIKILNKFETAK